MTKLSATVAVGLLATVSLATAAPAAAPDPVIGTWQLNVSKSTFPAGPVPKSEIRTYSQSGSGMRLLVQTVLANGREAITEATYRLDGKDYPVKGGAGYDSLSGHQVNPRTATFTLKKEGKAVGTTTRTVSTDGKTLTARRSVTTASGDKSENVMVFDKQ